MRKMFPLTVHELMKQDKRIVVLLGDISVYGFQNCFKDFPERTFNIGICEQSMVGMAAGLSMAGFIPIVHTIEPFLVDRAFEQIKDDFGYQELKGNIVGVDVSETAPNLGYTHQCPYALNHMQDVQGMMVHNPWDAEMFDKQFKEHYDKGLNYFRIK
jgi:transketolase